MTDSRLEKKFVYFNGDQSFKLFLSLGMFKEPYPARIVNSIYFDTPNLRDVWDNINGYGLRKKIRIRWYNDLNNSNVYLEEKKKINFLTQKKTELLGKFSNYEEFKKYFQKDLSNKINIFINKKLNLKSTLFVQYRRNYFELNNKKLRVTLDQNLKIFLQYPNKFINLDKTILELKYKKKDAEFVRKFVNETKLNNRNQKFSKYVNSFIELNNCGFI